MPIRHDTKKHPFCMSFNKLFVKDGLQDNHWFGHSVMKPVDFMGPKNKIFNERRRLLFQ